MTDCLFCKIIAGEIPSEKIYEDEYVYAFNDIDPQAPAHFLVIPKEHIVSAADINGSNSLAAAKCLEAAARIAKDLRLESFRVVSNVGAQAGQSVFHLHFHILSGRDMAWPPG
jgi:histidine triad (HIT) family protein